MGGGGKWGRGKGEKGESMHQEKGKIVCVKEKRKRRKGRTRGRVREGKKGGQRGKQGKDTSSERLKTTHV